MKRIYPWMAPIHKAERTLYNQKLKLAHRVKDSFIHENKKMKTIDIVIHTTIGQKIVTSIPNVEASYKPER